MLTASHTSLCHKTGCLDVNKYVATRDVEQELGGCRLDFTQDHIKTNFDIQVPAS